MHMSLHAKAAHLRMSLHANAASTATSPHVTFKLHILYAMTLELTFEKFHAKAASTAASLIFAMQEFLKSPHKLINS